MLEFLGKKIARITDRAGHECIARVNDSKSNLIVPGTNVNDVVRVGGKLRTSLSKVLATLFNLA